MIPAAQTQIRRFMDELQVRPKEMTASLPNIALHPTSPASPSPRLSAKTLGG